MQKYYRGETRINKMKETQIKPDLKFGTPIWHYSCPNAETLNKSLISAAYKLQKKEPPNNRSGINTWQSNKSVHFMPETQSFFSGINELIVGILKTHSPSDLIFGVQSAWFNVNPPNSLNARHNHRGHAYAGVYILQTPPDSGALILHDPRFQLSVLPPVFPPSNLLDSRLQPPLKAGDVIIFPSWLEHSVSLNESREDRISLAFNMGWERQVSK